MTAFVGKWTCRGMFKLVPVQRLAVLTWPMFNFVMGEES